MEIPPLRRNDVLNRPTATVRLSHLQSRIDGLAFHGQHSKNALMHPSQGLPATKRVNASWPRANSRRARLRLPPTDRSRNRTRLSGASYSGP